MQYQAKKQVLSSGVFVLSASAIAALVWALVWPVPDWKAQANRKLKDSSSNQVERAGDGGNSSARQQEAEQVDWSRRLRWSEKPLAKNDNETKPQRVTQAKPSRFQLLGTIIEKGHSFAMIQDQAGNIDLQPEGGVLQLSPKGTTVAEVKSKSVVLIKNNRRTELKMAARTSPAIAIEAGAAVEPMAEEDIDAMDAEPVFNSLEEELDWLNGDDFDPDDFDEMGKDFDETESSLGPKQREGGSR